MDSKKSRTNQLLFQKFVRTDIKSLLESHGYKTSYDNKDIEENNSRRWIFKIVFKGDKTIEIFNDDWRDYTEYFRVKLNSREILIINVNDYEDLNDADSLLKNVLLEQINTSGPE